MRRVAVMSLLGALAACSSGPSPVSPQAPEATEPAAGTSTVPLPPRGATGHGGSAVASLIEEAAGACAAGDIAAGLARLDRGLRIAPQSPELYLEMARCHSAADDPTRAAAAAERGLAYCSGATCRRLRKYLRP